MSSNQERKLVVKLQQNPDPRVHFLLFKNNTPFKPKVVPSKLRYQRHNKHRSQNNPLD